MIDLHKPSGLRRVVKHLVLFLCMLLAIYIVVRLGLGLIGTDEQQVQALERWKNSPALIWIRYGIYGFVFLYWGRFIRKLNPKLPSDVVSATYRPLIIGVVLYEFLLARNLIGALLN